MRAFSYAWSLSVTWQRWRSHHSTRHIPKLMLHADLMALWLIEVLHFGNRDFRPFLLLLPWSWPDDLNIRTWPVFPGSTPDVQISIRQGFRKLSSHRQTDKQMIDRQPDTTEIVYHAASQVVDTTLFTRLNAMLLVIICHFSG